MICSIFVKKFNKTLEKYKYDDRFVKYLLLDLLHQNRNSKFESVLSYLNYYYGEIIDYHKLYDYLFQNYEISNQVISLSETQKYEFNRIKRIEHIYYSLKIKGEDYIENELFNNLNLSNNDLDYLLSLVYSLISNELEFQDDYVFMICFDIITNKNSYIDQIDYLLYKDEKAINVEINDYVLSNKLKSILCQKGVKIVSDLSIFSNTIILVLFSHDIEKILANIYFHRNTNYFHEICIRINDIFDSQFKDDKTKEIVFKRCGICNEKMTLAAVANEYGVTKERIRQIVAKNIEKIKGKANCFKQESMFLFNVMVGLDKNYLTREQLIDYIKDEYVVDKLFFMCDEFDFPIHFDSIYNVLYDPNNYNVSELIADVELKIGKAIGVESINDYDSFEKSVIKNNYRIAQNELMYVKKGVNTAEIAVDIIDEMFLNGFKLGDDEDFEAVNNAFKSKYKTNCPIGTKHALNADLIRYDYCYIDRGTVVNRKYVPELAPELIAEINEYLSEANDIVYYQSLFEAFKDKLNEYGVTNRYYLKGLIDNHLSSEFTHQRDYIITGSSYKSPAEFIISEINSYDGIVDLNTIKNEFPGVKDYVFLNYLSKMNGVIWIKYMQSFILLSKVNISNEFKNALFDNINYLFKSLNSKVIVCSKLYARMKIMNEELMEEVKIFDTEFAFFSLVSTLLKNEFYFRRPYISCDASIDLSHNSLIVNYINTLPKFNSQILQSYLNKMHLRYVDSYLDFLISNSNNFVQINMDTAVKKELLMLNEITLNAIKNDLNYYINSFGPIDSRKYNDYSNLPRLRVGWNKYLLVGIIRTFLNDEYIIEYTDSMYNATDFIIRRK